MAGNNRLARFAPRADADIIRCQEIECIRRRDCNLNA
jgi:hypothetical protein